MVGNVSVCMSVALYTLDCTKSCLPDENEHDYNLEKSFLLLETLAYIMSENGQI